MEAAIEHLKALRIQAKKEAKELVFRFCVKFSLILAAYTWIIYPLIFDDHTKAIWNVADRLPFGKTTILSMTFTSCGFLALALIFAKLRAVAGLTYASVMAFFAFLPYQGTFTFTLAIVSLLALALSVLGADDV